MINKYVAIHAHFYQPPRENAWLEAVEHQGSAYPFHDWNERITTECYAPNAAARLLDSDGLIEDIINNYSLISFNFGPTLLSWMEEKEPDVYEAIIEADRLSQQAFSGHGSALAQVYNHIIMPLANRRDKQTQISWGIRDFEKRFGRFPEGMWLAETAVDLETLELLVENGIKFTILAPNQAHIINKIGSDGWADVSPARVDPRRPYLCRLPSGKEIILFFYDGIIAREVAFNNLLSDGIQFGERMLSTLDYDSESPQLAHIATDGETYGHHHHHGDMALAYCLRHIRNSGKADLTIYGEYLEKFEPEYEVEIFENSSWSCAHGIERWRSDCGCKAGGRPGWNQSWRAPLRNAMNWLRDNLSEVYETYASELLEKPWKAREDYIDIILKRGESNTKGFFDKHAIRELDDDEIIIALKLLEMQRHALLMFTSCAWFFDEISGIETVQVLQYAARALQLTRQATGLDFETGYARILTLAPSNIDIMEHGGKVYDTYIKVAQVDLKRVAAHYAAISLINPESDMEPVYCYKVSDDYKKHLATGKHALCYGKTRIASLITLEESFVHYLALHFGEHNIVIGVKDLPADDDTSLIENDIEKAFSTGDIPLVLMLIEKHYRDSRYSLRHLFRDDKRRILNELVEARLNEIDFVYRQQYEYNLPLIQVMKETNIPLPGVLSTTIDFVCNTDLRNALSEKKIDMDLMERAIEQAKIMEAELDKVTLGFIGQNRITELITEMNKNIGDISLLKAIDRFLSGILQLDLNLNLWKAQNIFYNINSRLLPEIQSIEGNGGDLNKEWLYLFKAIGSKLQMGVRE
ncbi:MAG: DUF3536 domain-containing protein [candidate division Zixibacteria bacterium]|nr:DUF3536 domain-containing protein [candidate division Zixibacteria bacterium]